MKLLAWSQATGDWQLLSFTDVLWVPDLVENLIGTSVVSSKLGSTTFSSGAITITDARGKSIVIDTTGPVPTASMVVWNSAEAMPASGLAFATVQKKRTQASRCQRLWHERLGHPSTSALRVTREATTGHDIPDKLAEDECDTCIISKARPKPSRSTHVVSDKLEAVSADLIGPWHGNPKVSYVLVIRDQWSGYAWTFALSKKSEAAPKLMEWMQGTREQTGRYPKSLRVDQGEAWTDSLRRWTAERGVSFTASPTSTSTQNIYVERHHQQLEKVTRSLLHRFKTPERWWPHAMEQATIISNRLAGSTRDEKTPHELWHGVPPSLTHLHVFGCKAFAVLPGSTRQTWTQKAEYKSRYLRQRALQGLYLGYSDAPGRVTGHKIFVPLLDRVVTVRDAHFRESHAGQQGEEKTSAEASYFWVGQNPNPAVNLDDAGVLSDSDEDEEDPLMASSLPRTSRQERRWKPSRPLPVPDQQSSEENESMDELENAPLTPIGGDEETLRRELFDELQNILGTPYDVAESNAATSEASMEMVTPQKSDESIFAESEVATTQDRSESPDPIDAWDPRDPMPSSYLALLADQKEHAHPRLNGADKRDAYAAAVFSATTKTAAGVEAPTTFEQAKRSDEWPQWRAAMEEELASLEKLGVYEEVDKPTHKKVIGTKWVFTKKRDGEGRVVRFKARLVAKGYVQREGIDFDEVFSPVARLQTIRLLLAYAARYNLQCHTVDVKTAFLHGEIDSEVLVQVPTLEGTNTPDKCWKLKRALYGLRQSPRLWHKTLKAALGKMGFSPMKADPCVMKRGDGADMIVLGIYVDDILVIGARQAMVERFKQALRSRFSITDGGEADLLLGFSLVRSEGKMTAMHQAAYINAVLSKFDINDPPRKATRPTLLDEPLRKWTGGTASAADIKRYASMVGSLSWIAQGTRPDLSFAVGALGRHMANPGPQHFRAARQVLEYLASTRGYQLTLVGDKTGLRGFADSDWGSDLDTRRSTTGFIFQIWETTVSWRSKLQPTVALSSVEAEYIALSQCAKEATWLTSLLAELGVHLATTPVLVDESRQALRSRQGELVLASTVPVLYSDSSGARAITLNPEHHDKTKHIDLAHHHIRDLLQAGKIQIQPVTSATNPSDIMTKAMPGSVIRRALEHLGIQ